MDLSGCSDPVLIQDSCLTGWVLIGSGGFGQIYRARHRQWCYDVAIKLLHHDDGSSSSLLREVKMMLKGSSEHVMQVLGIFQGRPPNSGPSGQLGLVMKYMEKGSLASLQNALNRVPPLPLLLRLAHQVALGINFLHNRPTPVLHLDLKPSNVLLDSDLNVKLTDFGLAKFYHSVSRVSKKDKDEEGGTLSYMPPEAFHTTYTPTKASDVYSYGILLWSIVTGKQPYANALSSIVRLRIPQGDRPSLEEFSLQAADQAELRRLKELMVECWETTSTQRPSSLECTTRTEELYQLHRDDVLDAVHQVQKDMQQRRRDGTAQPLHAPPSSGCLRAGAGTVQDNVLTGRPPVQEMADRWSANQRIKDPPVCQTDHKAKASSVHPIGAAPAPQGRAAADPRRDLKQVPSQQIQRQVSSPNPAPPRPHSVCILLSDATGVQIGHNNIMNITGVASGRRRHPTAPPCVTPPSPLPGSRKK